MSNLRLQTGAIPEHILKLMPKEDRAPMGKAGLTFEEATEKAEAKSEKELQNQIANWLRLNGFYFIRQWMNKKSNIQSGAPDFHICDRGQFVGMEIKVGANHATPEQEKEMARIRESGGQAYVVRSLQEVILILRK